jgi:tyrosyl-tRNA synthetase
MASDVYSEFAWRGMVVEGTEGVRDLLAREHVTCYIGFDPTASSLHVGSLLVMLALARLQRFGHSPIAIVGGGTGLIGDPSGKTQERQLLSIEQIEENLAGIKAQLSRVLDFERAGNPALIVNNADWLTKLDLMGFLRDIGKYFTVNYMLAKESVKRRLESEDGISYTEFSYLMLQAYDFLTVFDRYGCTLQLGGSDQWGNIVAGTDLIRRLRGGRAHGLVLPLVTASSGVKFGKTEAGTIWLDPARTTPYQFYQFWINVDDRDVVKYLKYFTFLEQQEVASVEAGLATAPERNSARLFGGGTVAETIRSLAESGGAPSIDIDAAELGARPLTLILMRAGMAASANQATQLIRAGGVYLNLERVTDERRPIRPEDAVDGVVLVQKGQRQKCLVRIGFPPVS